MSKKINKVLEEVLEKITPKKNEIDFMQKYLDLFLEKTQKRIKKLKIKAELFVGGSWGKGTLIKKDHYDIDIYLRFNKIYPEEELPKLTKKILKWTKGTSLIHGSRDYFQMKVNQKFCLELIPVKKVTKPEDANNITDLSHSHVKYIRKKIKNKKTLDGIKLAKAFCHSSKTYGAESYVHGFSGYAIELLVYYYRDFLKFLKALSKNQNKKLIIDIEKLHKKENILLDLNSSKLDSPIVLIDPTFKSRNALAALSNETYGIFRKKAKEFLKNPSIKYFEPKKLNLNEIKEKAAKKNYEFVVIKTRTKKQKGDIAGTKLLKFHKHLTNELEKYFETKQSGFDYLKDQIGRGYFVLKKRKEVLFSGPEVKDKKNAVKFKSQHKNTFVKNKRLYAKKQLNFSAKEFLNKWKTKNKRKIKEMYITGLKIY